MSKLTSIRRISPIRRVELLLHHFTPGERMVLYALSVALALSALALLAGVNAAVSVNVPTSGGSLTEGVIGPARFVNPLLALSDADQDLTQLVYSGLTRPLADGTIVPDLAESYSISADGTVYTFKLRANAKFQDGAPVTSADVLYTINQAQNPDIKSPRRADWEGVAVSAPDSRTIIFKLPKAYAPFIENTAIGILPQHLWKDVTAEEFPFSQLNVRPIGSGPYKIASVTTDSTGSPVRYTLVPFSGYARGKAYLNKITLMFYPNEQAEMTALNGGSIDALAGVSADELSSAKRSDIETVTVPLPRIFGVFFNQNHSPALSDAAARAALEAAIDKNRLVSMVLEGYGVPLSSPIPPSVSAASAPRQNVSTAYTQDSIALARDTLSKGGWSFDQASGTWTKNKQTLQFTLTTADAPELVKTADAIATAWRQAGVKVSVQVYPIAELNESVIRPRQYDALLFGEVVGRSMDLFAFWHSSQRNDPGLNLALYANSKADTLLSQARATTNTTDRDKLYSQFADILAKDRPAIFLYAPDFIYVVPKGLHGVTLGALTAPAERFLTVQSWYMDTERVWSIFTNQTD
ncbi:MAG: peptide ABC transporter substrate-binding protein, partial [Candidatus Kaiserbacteria bacterium]|nr:peptide ABC transporter substrate-binding protein [Candidatus Kaiserbacteria bacterium]